MSEFAAAVPFAMTTGIGSLPGSSADEAMRMAFGESLDIPYMAELPARGPGSDMIGRTANRLVDINVELVPSSWRVTRRPGFDARRATDFWAWDFDALQQAADGYRGPLKVQLVGPWTLAASLELANGHRFLTDQGALRDVQESLAEGALGVLDEVRRRVPGAQLVLQLDEPSLSAVLAGAVPTASGFGRLPAVGPHEAGIGLRRVIDAVGVDVVVHSCAPQVPVRLLRQAGAAAVMLDCELLSERDYDELGATLDDGLLLIAGVVQSARAVRRGEVDAAAARIRQIARAVGVSSQPANRQTSTVFGDARIGVTSCCGFAGRTWEQAVEATRAITAVARQLIDNPTPD